MGQYVRASGGENIYYQDYHGYLDYDDSYDIMYQNGNSQNKEGDYSH